MSRKKKLDTPTAEELAAENARFVAYDNEAAAALSELVLRPHRMRALQDLKSFILEACDDELRTLRKYGFRIYLLGWTDRNPEAAIAGPSEPKLPPTFVELDEMTPTERQAELDDEASRAPTERPLPVPGHSIGGFNDD